MNDLTKRMIAETYLKIQISDFKADKEIMKNCRERLELSDQFKPGYLFYDDKLINIIEFYKELETVLEHFEMVDQKVWAKTELMPSVGVNGYLHKYELMFKEIDCNKFK